jgi:TRAP-type mannitol/chloroaromatic compound transport system permease small subunit
MYLAWASVDYVALSWQLREASRESGGMPYPMVPLLKSILVVMPILLGMQGVSMLQRCIRTLRAG